MNRVKTPIQSMRTEHARRAGRDFVALLKEAGEVGLAMRVGALVQELELRAQVIERKAG